jgi:hypothetical protein
MTKVNLVMEDGTRVTIDGTADEVALVLQRISQRPIESSVPESPLPKRRRRGAQRRGGASGLPNARARVKGPADYIRELIAGDFFKTKRGLADVQKRLEEGAHIYPITHLSPVLFRLVHLKELRRIKEEGTWKYVNP